MVGSSRPTSVRPLPPEAVSLQPLTTIVSDSRTIPNVGYGVVEKGLDIGADLTHGFFSYLGMGWSQLMNLI